MQNVPFRRAVRPGGLLTWCVCISVLPGARGSTAAPAGYVKKETWQATMLSSRTALKAGKTRDRARKQVRAVVDHIERDFPVQWDWALQDGGLDAARWFNAGGTTAREKAMIERVLAELGPDAAGLRAAFDRLVREGAGPADQAWLGLYVKACEKRRAARLAPVLRAGLTFVFTKHFNLGGSHYAYTEGQSDAQAERQFQPGTSLCLLAMDNLYGTVQTLIDDPNGVIRDPAVSYDAERILFAWKKSDRRDDYHLYEMDVTTRDVRQLTFGLGFADYEGVYLPNGDIVFSSTRCVQTVDCWWTEVSNLYTCGANGRYLRRLGFDQVHTNYPTVLDDGRVIYTRWEYSDRGQIYPQPLFQMNPDGTAQTEYYGNNSWFPTTIMHARGIPGTRTLVAVLSGHHSRQTGTLAIVDVSKGNQENAGIQEIAPVRETPAVRVDAYGQRGPLFQYPYPLSETEFVVTYNPHGWSKKPVRFAIYFMTIDGRRELLAADPHISCNQPVLLAPRPVPHVRPSAIDHRKTHGVFYVQDIYVGPGLADVPRGTIKRIRVVAIRYRAAGVRSNGNGGPAGGALISTPIAIGNGSWDVKVVLGTATVHEDGSACFTVPARTPVYFQALDAKNHAVQTMRSWSTLQPGERYSCVGCHEYKSQPPEPYKKTTLAMKAGCQELEPFYGEPRGFSFPKEVQPIMDRHCVRCHKDRTQGPPGAGAPDPGGTPAADDAAKDSDKRTIAFSLLGTPNPEQHSGRAWSDAYLALTQALPRDGKRPAQMRGKPNRLVSWISAQSAPPMLPPYYAGAARSGLITLLEEGHYDVRLSPEELDKIACWIDLLVPYCGDYTEANVWNEREVEKYAHFLQKRRRMEELERESIELLLADGP